MTGNNKVQITQKTNVIFVVNLARVDTVQMFAKKNVNVLKINNMNQEINVLSLFNGMNTGRQALENVGIKVNKYYSSEIKPYAIELTQYHFPDTIQIGDVTKWKDWDIDWKSIDLILSGSPCQDLSAAGKRAGINGEKSSLFFTFVEILEHIKLLNPNVLFLQENVGSASKLDVGIMSRALGVYPVRINSSLVTAQLRDRYYWSNIRTKETMFDLVTDIPQPKDKGILLKDILTSGYNKRKKANCLTEGLISKNISKDLFSENWQKYLKKRPQSMVILINENDLLRLPNKIEMCRLQGFPDDYCDILTTTKAGSLLGDGWTLPIIEHIFTFIKR
jgi:site-specific DNA-cytosine methylase